MYSNVLLSLEKVETKYPYKPYDVSGKTLFAAVLSNRAMTARRLNQHESALEDAKLADSVLSDMHAVSYLSVKAKYAVGESLSELGRAVEACDVLRQALRLARSHENEKNEKSEKKNNSDVAAIISSLRRAARTLPLHWICHHWACAITHGEQCSTVSPNPREGSLLKQIRPHEKRATKAEISRRLLDLSVGDEPRWRLRTVEAWVNSRMSKESPVKFPFGVSKRSRCVLHLVRALVYKSKGDAEQFLKDSKFAAAYAPEINFVPGNVNSTLTQEAVITNNPTSVLVGETHALLATAYASIHVYSNSGTPTDTSNAQAATRHFLGKSKKNQFEIENQKVNKPSPSLDSKISSAMRGRVILTQGGGVNGVSDDLVVDAGVACAVEWQRALECDPTNNSYKEERNAAIDKFCVGFGNEFIDTIKNKGSLASIQWLEQDKWQHAPEYVRQRPKYYYFFEMMRERINTHYPELPQPVMDKLLSTDADELNLLLQYPEAIRGQTEEYLDVFREHGEAYLGTYTTPTLTWDEVKALKGGDGVVGLGSGGETVGAPGILPALTSAKKKMEKAKAFGDRYGGKQSGNNMLDSVDEVDDPLDAESDSDSPEPDTDRAMLGASGEDGLTRSEEKGLEGFLEGGQKSHKNVFSSDHALPPDQMRAYAERHASGQERLTEEWTFLGEDETKTEPDHDPEIVKEENREEEKRSKCVTFHVEAMDEMD